MVVEDPQGGVVALVDGFIDRAHAARATDVHFEPHDDGLHVRYRIDALLQDVDTVPSPVAPNVIARLKVLAGLLTYRTDVPQEGAFTRDTVDVRVATFPTVRGERVVLRLLAGAAGAPTLDELGHGPETVAQLRHLAVQPQGLVLLCGPAGSGKTTTLHALLREVLTARPGSSVLAVEDPVEIRVDGVTQIEIDADRGLTYPVALRSLLRQDPQVLMIGEIRDADTARLVVEAALTGHLLLSTLHSGSPAEAIIRLREMGVPPYQVTSTLRAVLAQRLLRTVCTACDAAQPRPDCATCLGSGYAGRTAIGQCVEMSPALRQAVLDGADVEALTQHCPGDLRTDARRLLAAGRTTADEIARVLGR
jgi:type II secretory ATPase GspE/PulE/Tfp pilus assembly ATPase PilB-like protein